MFPAQDQEKARVFCLIDSFSFVLEVLASAVNTRQKDKRQEFEKEKKMKFVLFADDMFEYMENLKKSILGYCYKELVNFKR